MQKLRYRYRLYPHPHQRLALARTFGCARVVWNDALALSQRLHQEGRKFPGGTELQRCCITQAKRTPERSWLSEVSNVPLQQSLRDLDQAFRSWWASRQGKRKGKVRAPRFKKRHGRQSIRFQRNAFWVEEHTLRLSKVGSIPMVWSRDLPSEPSSVTIIEDASGRYFASFVVETERPQLQPNGKAVGIDLGLASLAVTSDGEKIAPPKFLRSALRRLRCLQRRLKHKRKGGHRLAIARRKVAKLHAKIGDQRLDFLHKLSTRIIRENQTVVLEDLNVSGMLKNRKLARSIMDAGWRMFRTLLEAKAGLHGRTVKSINRWEPTSQRCSTCGHQDGKKELSIRSWQCSACGAEHDRDLNAARNILAAGLAERLNGRGAKRKTDMSVAGCEASTHLNQEVQRCPA